MARRPDGQPPGRPERPAPRNRSFSIFIAAKGAALGDRAAFERKLYVIRKRVEHAIDMMKIKPLSGASSISSACRRTP